MNTVDLVEAPCEAGSRGGGTRGRGLAARWLLLPSLSDLLFLVFLGGLFLSGTGWPDLLADGDTGWHIRTGEYILKTHSVPSQDLFLYTSPGHPWYAWEWLADVAFGALHQAAGLKGVLLFCGSAICLTLVILFRYMIWRGASLPIALVLTIFAAGSLRFHYLARPHIFTTLLVVATLWMLDRDWSRPGRAVWLLVPLTVLWANVHGGFLALFIALGCLEASAAVQRDAFRAKRYLILTAACAAATLVNPYGWQLHRHIWVYLRSDWIVRNIVEFQSPLLWPGSILQLEILLFLGLVCTAGLIRRLRCHEALLIVIWAHAALTSARHITIYQVVALPALADQLTRLWDRWTGGSRQGGILQTLRELSADMLPAARRTSVWVPVFLVLLASGIWRSNWPVDFPAQFPGKLMARNWDLLNGPGRETARVISPDIWGGYLDYKFYPQRRVFIDGRSDYYGPTILKEYLSIRAAEDRWPELAARYGWHFALIPPDWPLARALKRSPDWILRDQDRVAVLYERRGMDAPTGSRPSTAGR